MKITHLIIIYMFLTRLSVLAEDDRQLTVNLNRWNDLSSKQLMEKGEYFRNVVRKPDSALVCFSIVANRYYEEKQNKDNIELSIEAMTHIAYLYKTDFYDFTKAVSYNLKAKELAIKHDCKEYLPFILINEANIASLRHFYINGNSFSEEALTLHKKAFYCALNQKCWYALLISFMNMMLRTTSYNKEYLIEKEMDIIKGTNIPDSITHLRYARCLIDGVKTWNNHLPDSALNYFKQLLIIAEQQKNPKQRAVSKIVANNYLESWYKEMQQYDKVLLLLLDNERLAKENNMNDHLLDAYENLSLFYRDMKNEAMEKKYYIMYLEGKDNLLNKQRLGSAKEAEFLFEMNKMNEEVRELAYKKQMQQRILWIVCAFTVIAIVMIFLLIVSRQRIQQGYRQLYQKNVDLLAAEELRRKDEEERKSLEEAARSFLKYCHNQMDDDVQEELFTKILHLMETSDEIYKESFCVEQLAELLGTKKNYVSQAINSKGEQTFSTLLNNYRLKEACRRMNNQSKYGNYSIEGIAQSVGYSSRSHFARLFKQFTGLTPSAYQKIAKEESENKD